MGTDHRKRVPWLPQVSCKVEPRRLCVADLPFLPDGKGYRGRCITGDEVLATRFAGVTPTVSLLIFS